jgi:hypothetical protein
MPRVALLLVAAATMGSDCCECCPTGFAEVQLVVVDGATGCPLVAPTVLEGGHTLLYYCAPWGIPDAGIPDAGANAPCAVVTCPNGIMLGGVRGPHTWTIDAPGYRAQTIQLDAGRECGAMFERYVALAHE